MTIHIRALKQYIHMELFIMLNKMVLTLTFTSMDELVCDLECWEKSFMRHYLIITHETL